jgi:DNA-binding CsgD family transcriptional regulator
VLSAIVSKLASHVAEGLRASTLLNSAAEVENNADGPGVVLLGADLDVLAATPAAQRWLSEIGGSNLARSGVPFAVCSAVATLHGIDTSIARAGLQPRVRVRTSSGRWLVVHASYLCEEPGSKVAVVIEPAGPDETTPLVLQAYALTRKELDVTRLVILGRSTKEIAAELHISEHTVNDHLKSIFDKAGVTSRRQLVAQIVNDHHRTAT